MIKIKTNQTKIKNKAQQLYSVNHTCITSQAKAEPIAKPWAIIKEICQPKVIVKKKQEQNKKQAPKLLIKYLTAYIQDLTQLGLHTYTYPFVFGPSRWVIN